MIARIRMALAVNELELSCDFCAKPISPWNRRNRAHLCNDCFRVDCFSSPECDLCGFHIYGLSQQEVDEAFERLHGAFTNKWQPRIGGLEEGGGHSCWGPPRDRHEPLILWRQR